MVKSQKIDSFFKRIVTHKDEERLTSTSKPENCLENPKIKENEKQLSKVPRVTYGELENVIDVQKSDQIKKNRLCLKTSIDIVRNLTLQDVDFSCDDKTSKARHQDAFLSMAKVATKYDDEFAKLVLENGPYLSRCASFQFRKEILHILSSKVKSHIREEIGDSKFCIVVDGVCDGPQKEQMALVLRFVDKSGFIQERFFDIVHVKDFEPLALKEEIYAILSRHNLDVSNIRGQGYDGASNMREQWNGLQTLILNECPYAYHIHCFEHKLLPALVCASSEVFAIQQFFSKLTSIVNFFNSCSKPHDESLAAKLNEIAHLLEINEIGEGANQIGSLQRVGDTCLRSHFYCICSLIRMYDTTCSILKKLADDGSTYCQSGDASIAYDNLTTFEFVFILHLMREILGLTSVLCGSVQLQCSYVVNVKDVVQTTKALLQIFRQDGWDKLLKDVKCFCAKHDIEVPQFNAPYVERPWNSRHQKDHITTEHYFRVEVFFVVIDNQLQELNSRFSDQAMELLTLCSALVPKDSCKTFDIDHICALVEKCYPMDFNKQEKIDLQRQLKYFIIQARQDSNLKKLSTIQELCTCLAGTRKAQIYYLIDRLLRLLMTLPVFTAATERSFSAMKIFKTMLRNTRKDGFLADSMLIYIEKEITKSFRSDSIIDDLKVHNDSHLCSSVNDCIIKPSGNCLCFCFEL